MSDSDESTRTVYRELCASYRSIDDFRAKLLGFLPLVTGISVVLLSNSWTSTETRAFAGQFLQPIGLFGAVVTVGLLCYELYGIKKCHGLIIAGKRLEEGLTAGVGQFSSRPREIFGIVNEPFAAGIVYPGALAAWIYVSRVYASPGTASSIAVLTFVLGMLFMLFCSIMLKRNASWI